MTQINIEIDKTFIEENAQEMGLLSATQVQTFTDEEKEQLRSNAGIDIDDIDGGEPDSLFDDEIDGGTP